MGVMVATALSIMLQMVVLHRSDGAEVTVNANQVTSLRGPAGPLGRLAPAGGCLVGMTDAKFLAVLESCAEIRRQLEGLGR